MRPRFHPSPAARGKAPSVRAAIRQATVAASLEGAEELALDGSRFEPGLPCPFEAEARPVCALADGAGQDREIGVLLSDAAVFARRPGLTTASVRLGKMWAQPSPTGWRLLERLVPAWSLR